MLEHETRLVPIEMHEGSYARNRDPAERPPWPKVGDKVYFRRRQWDQDVIPAEIVWVESWDDPQPGTENLYRIVRDVNGVPVMDLENGILVKRRVRVEDPWPAVILKLPNGDLQPTWESRIRGGIGWLPLNYLERPVVLPSERITRPYRNVNW